MLAADAEEVRFVYLKGPAGLIAKRLANRQGHFFDPALLQTQFDDLEEPRGVLEADISLPPKAIAGFVIAALGLEQSAIHH